MLSRIFGKKKKRAIFQLTPEQDEFLGSASLEYNAKLSEMDEKYNTQKLGWNYDQESGKFDLLDASDKVVFRGDAQIVGSYFPPDGTWEWAWNNPNVDKQASSDSLAVKAYGEAQGLDYLCTGIVDVLGDEVFAAYLAAVGLKLSGAEYAYRGNTGSLIVYLLVSNITKA